MIDIRKKILHKWPVSLIIILVTIATTITSQIHNHEAGEETDDCPAYIADLFFSADEITTIAIAPVSQPIFHLVQNVNLISDFSDFVVFLNRAPPSV